MKKILVTLMLCVGLIAIPTVAGSAVLPILGGGTATNCSGGYVSISFDDGPTTGTKSLLTALSNNGMRATFFVNGNHISDNPDLIKNIVSGGHSVQNHSWDHQDFAPLDEKTALIDLAMNQGLIYGLTNVKPEFFRPPYGNTSELTAQAEADLGLTEVVWTVDTNDWDGRSAQQIADAALTVKPGGFILMHDGYPNTVKAIPLIAKGLKARNLCTGKIVKSANPTNAWWERNFYATVAPW